MTTPFARARHARGTRRARILGASITAGALVAGAASALPAHATTVSATVTAPVVADATVSGASNWTNYGSAKTLSVDASPIVRSYLKFSVSGTAGSTVTKATLRLYALGSNTSGVKAYATNNSWSESSIVFANANAIGTGLGTSGAVTQGTWANVDVTSLVKGDGTYSLLLTTPSAAGFSFGSRESTTVPRVVVQTSTTTTTTTSTTATASPTPTATATATASPSPTATATTSPTASPTSTTTATTTTTTTASRKLLIHHGWDLATPSQIKSHAALIDSRPFDGITVNLPTLSNDTLSGTAHSLTEYQTALSPMPAMTHVTHNFVIVRMMQPSYDYYSDAQWATAAQNFKNLAQAARATGLFDGIVLDTEYYGSGTNPWNFGTSTTPWTYSATAGATPGHTATDARDTATRRGKQIADAVYAAWPSASVMTTYGPWVGETKTASTGFAGTGYNDVAWANELMGAFTVGMVESASAAGTQYVDGGELYQARTSSQYLAAYNWVKSGLASSGSFLVPSTFAPSYPKAVSSAWGVFDHDMLQSGWPIMTASAFQSQMTLALKQADKYSWQYSEAYDWLGTGYPSTVVPQSFLDATANARVAGNQ